MTGAGPPADPGRRRSLLLIGAAAASAVMGPAARSDEPSWDLLVVGAGTAGLPAAIQAARGGARVLLIEKSTQLGGTLWFSGGQMSAAGTQRQRALGIDDSPAQHLADIMRISRGTAVKPLVARAVESAPNTLDWLEDAGFQIGEGFPVAATGHEPYSRRRVWGGTERGLSILKVLERELASVRERVTLHLDTEVTGLLQDPDGTVGGVRARTRGGPEVTFRGSAVLLASGGYMSNPALFERINGVPMYRQAGWPMNTGIGIDLGLAAGGYLRGRENYLCDFGSVPATLDAPSPEFARSIHHPDKRRPWELWVNAAGQRFLREDEPSVDERERGLLQQPSHRYWVVFDERALREAPPLVRGAPPAPMRDWTRDELRAAFERYPAFTSAPGLQELAGRAGIDAAGLAATVTAYNQALRRSTEDPLGRHERPAPLAEGPFYAIRHQGGTLISVAGLAVDPQLRVLRQDGGVVPNLYAAGELLGNGSLSGQAFCGGMMVTPALTFGRLVGEQIASGLT